MNTAIKLILTSALAQDDSLKICEGNQATLSCPPNSLILINSATYGRTDRLSCRHDAMSDTNCKAANSLQIVRDLCEGKNQCVARANNGVFGDPCAGTHKYLAIDYECRNV